MRYKIVKETQVGQKDKFWVKNADTGWSEEFCYSLEEAKKYIENTRSKKQEVVYEEGVESDIIPSPIKI